MNLLSWSVRSWCVLGSSIKANTFPHLPQTSGSFEIGEATSAQIKAILTLSTFGAQHCGLVLREVVCRVGSSISPSADAHGSGTLHVGSQGASRLSGIRQAALLSPVCYSWARIQGGLGFCTFYVAAFKIGACLKWFGLCSSLPDACCREIPSNTGCAAQCLCL
jgi:hypothetical protein